jgi:hypothetical protein
LLDVTFDNYYITNLSDHTTTVFYLPLFDCSKHWRTNTSFSNQILYYFLTIWPFWKIFRISWQFFGLCTSKKLGYNQTLLSESLQNVKTPYLTINQLRRWEILGWRITIELYNYFSISTSNFPIKISLILRPYLLQVPTTQQKYTSTTQTTVRQLPLPVNVMGVSFIKLLCSTTTTFIQVPIFTKRSSTTKSNNKNKKRNTPTLFLVLILYYDIFSLRTSTTN